MVEKEPGETIKRFRSDEQGEYTSRKLNKMFENAGIVHETTSTYRPKQNRVAERANRTIFEKSRFMISHFELAKSLWEDAVKVSVCLKSRTQTKVLGTITTHELWAGEKSSIEHYRLFSCCAYAFEEDHLRAKKLIFLGYTRTDRNFRLLDREEKRIFVTQHVKFDVNSSGLKISQGKLGAKGKVTIIPELQIDKGLKE